MATGTSSSVGFVRRAEGEGRGSTDQGARARERPTPAPAGSGGNDLEIQKKASEHGPRRRRIAQAAGRGQLLREEIGSIRPTFRPPEPSDRGGPQCIRRRRPRCGPRFWTRESTTVRSARCTGFCRSTERCVSAGTSCGIRTIRSRSSWRKRRTRFGRGHNEAARSGQVDLLLPLRDSRHLLPVRDRVDVGSARKRRARPSSHQRELPQAEHRSRPAHHPRRPRSMVRRLAPGRPRHNQALAPYVSNDNPYSESQFKTMKYCPEFPSRFGCLEDGRLFCRGFFDYYNNAHGTRDWGS